MVCYAIIWDFDQIAKTCQCYDQASITMHILIERFYLIGTPGSRFVTCTYITLLQPSSDMYKLC